jgi:hypothetical protein
MSSKFFAGAVRDYVLQHAGQPVSVLQAGCLAPLRELGLGELIQHGYDFTGDLRTVPIPQRAYDVVYCALLLG